MHAHTLCIFECRAGQIACAVRRSGSHLVHGKTVHECIVIAPKAAMFTHTASPHTMHQARAVPMI